MKFLVFATFYGLSLLPLTYWSMHIQQTIKERTKLDIRIGRLSDEATANINRILKMNTRLDQLQKICPLSKRFPKAYAIVLAAARAVQSQQDFLWIYTQGKVVSSGFLPRIHQPWRQPTSQCGVPGTLQWQQQHIIQVHHRIAGSIIAIDSEQRPYWKFHNNNVRRI